MNIKNLIPSAMLLSLFLPTNIKDISLMIFFISFIIVNHGLILSRRYYYIKFFCVVPILISCFFVGTENINHLIRFLPIFSLIILFPYNKIKINYKILITTAVLLLIYAIASQFLIAFDILNEFRNKFYLDNEAVKIFDYGIVQDTDFTGVRSFRAGGIFWNPNVLASHVLLLYFIIIYSAEALNEDSFKLYKFKGFITFSTTLVSLLFSGSRTYIVTLIAHLIILSWIKRNELLIIFKKNKFSLFISGVLILTTIFYVIYSIFDVVMAGIKEDSANEKLIILSRYLNNLLVDNDFIRILFGGFSNIQFDADLGYLIGLIGLFGYLTIFFLHSLLFFINREFLTIWASVFMIGFGNSLIYNLNNFVELLIIYSIFFTAHYNDFTPKNNRIAYFLKRQFLT